MTAPDERVHLFGSRARSIDETVRLAVEALREVAPVMSEERLAKFAEVLGRRLAEGTP